jgi:hypothetical protein
VRLTLLGLLCCCRYVLAGQNAQLCKSEFPFEFREGLLWVQVQASESEKSLNFLLDTGAKASVVNLETAKELRLPQGHPAQVLGVGVSMDAF